VLNGPDSEPELSSAPELQLPSPDAALQRRTETVDVSSRPASVAREPDDAGSRATDSETAAESPPVVVRTEPAVAAAQPEITRATVPTGPTGPAGPAAAVVAGGAWSVQIGAFGERANAVQLAGRVSEFGYQAQVSEFRSNGQTMHRVRVEGFASRAAAEAASSSLSAHGVPARVVPAD
jgi:cell division septation protein DedD